LFSSLFTLPGKLHDAIAELTDVLHLISSSAYGQVTGRLISDGHPAMANGIFFKEKDSNKVIVFTSSDSLDWRQTAGTGRYDLRSS
jgi:hypothetical protein